VFRNVVQVRELPHAIARSFQSYFSQLVSYLRGRFSEEYGVERKLLKMLDSIAFTVTYDIFKLTNP
jgi:hypothetical protein